MVITYVILILLGEHPKTPVILFKYPASRFSFARSPVHKSIRLMHSVVQCPNHWPFRLGSSSLAQLMFGTPYQGASRLDIRKTLYSFPSVTRTSCEFLLGLTLFHFVFSPDLQSFSLSRFLADESCNLRDQIGGTDTAPFLPFGHYHLSMISSNQGTARK